MADNLPSFGKSFRPVVFARFMLENGDSISIEGNSITQVFFEMHKRFPESFKYKSIEFSGKDIEEAKKNMEEFFFLVKKYG